MEKYEKRLSLDKHLTDCGCKLRGDDFRDLEADIFAGRYPSLTVEDVICDAEERERFVGLIRHSAKCFEIPSALILHTLLNLRKRGTLSLKSRKVS